MAAVAPSFRSPFRRDRDADETADLPPDGEPEGDGPADDEAQADGDGEWLAYELHEWALETRNMLAQILTADGVPHSWQGTTLLVHETQEETVDALLEEVASAEERGLDPDEPQTAFEMEGWSGELQAALTDRLGGAGVPHAIDEDGDLVVHEIDEEQVELIIEELLARVEEEGLEELEGLGANDLLSALFIAVDRLRRDVRDAEGVLGVVEHGRRLEEVATPFGFAATTWRSLRETTRELVGLIESEESTDADVTDLALRLRDTLQRLV